MKNLFAPNHESLDLQPPLISRRREIAALEEFYTQGGRMAVIFGRTGSGKTSLLNMYLRPTFDSDFTHHLFPGGIFHTYAFGPEPIEAFVQRNIRLPLTARTLMVIDEGHNLSPEELHSLANLIETQPQFNLLVASQRPLSILHENQLDLKLGGFTPDEFQELISLRLKDFDPKITKKFYDYVEGNPYLAEAAISSIGDGIITANQIFESFQNFEGTGIIGLDGKPVHRKADIPKRIVIDIKDANRQLLQDIRKNPELLRLLPSRKFEEIVADLLTRQGYQVELTPPSSDGGFDIYAAKQEGIGKFLYLVECKRYTPPKKVGVAIVRALYGVVRRHQANAGVIVTTSYFTSDAKEFHEELKYQIHLRDYIVLQQWLQKFGSLSNVKPTDFNTADAIKKHR